MPQILILKGGEFVTLFESDQILEYVEEYMGYDAKQFIRELLTEIEELREENDDLLSENLKMKNGGE